MTSKSSSSNSHQTDKAKFHNSSPLPGSGMEQQIQFPTHKISSKSPEGSPQEKRHREESIEIVKSTPSKKSKTPSGVVDLEELLAQSYPKEGFYTPEVRRSSRAKYKPVTPVESAKKWSANEEICVARALLETSSPAGKLNMNDFYERAKEELKETSNSQLYEKVRTMNKRFQSIQSKLEEQNIPEESFAFRTPQEPAMFQLWKQIWGNNDNNNISANGDQKARDGNLSEAGNPRKIEFENKTEELDDGLAAAKESTGDQRQQEEEEPQQRNLQEKSPHQTLAEEGNETTTCEGKGLQNRMKTLLESTEQRVEALIQGSYNRLGVSFGGGCMCSTLLRRMKDLMDGVNSVQEFPGLSDAEAKELQQKWRRHKIQELKMFSDCLGLIHAQCNAFLQNLDN